MAANILERIDQLKSELDTLRPLPPDVVGQVGQKLRLEWNYHSNAVEGNSLTLGETRSLILHGITAHGKPMRDHLDIQGHDDAVKAVEEAAQNEEALNEVFIRNLHRVLLREPYDMDARAPGGRIVKRRISIGSYKTAPNNVLTTTGEVHYFTAPEVVKPEMTDLLDWYHDGEQRGEHPIVLAAVLHYRFVAIHPFDDGNGRMARLLMNLILSRHGFAVAMIRAEDRGLYIDILERGQRTGRSPVAGDLREFIEFVASCCESSLRLHLRAARGESIDEPGDVRGEIDLFKKSLGEPPDQP
ncbi:MAG: Fic family protein [Acidobacteria bacterium]|nr:Fic family protein [Acidobacteriota bacterium]